MSLTLWKHFGKMTPTGKSRRDAAIAFNDATLRPVHHWQQIFAEQTSDTREAAARIFGDLYCYTSTRKIKGYDEPRPEFFTDVEQMARAIEGHEQNIREALSALVEVVECALDAGLFLSVDGKRPEVLAVARAKEALTR